MKVGDGWHDPMPSGRISTIWVPCLLLPSIQYHTLLWSTSQCIFLQGAWIGCVLCGWNMDILYLQLKLGIVSPLPDDATTGIVHCDASSPNLGVPRHRAFVSPPPQVILYSYTPPYSGWDGVGIGRKRLVPESRAHSHTACSCQTTKYFHFFYIVNQIVLAGYLIIGSMFHVQKNL